MDFSNLNIAILDIIPRATFLNAKYANLIVKNVIDMVHAKLLIKHVKAIVILANLEHLNIKN